MKTTFVVLSAAFALSSASVLPITFEFGGNMRPTVKAVRQCEGHENDILQVIDGSSQEEVCMPGDMDVSVHTRLAADLPNDLIFDLKLEKLEPFPMTVPCLNGIGSCPYDICPMIENSADILCPSFPENQPCSCPLLAGDFVLSGVKVPVADMGPILGSVMEGSYAATAELYGASNPDNKLGCIIFSFSLKQCS